MQLEHLATVIAAAQIGAAIALLNGVLTTLGQGRVASQAIESIARQPEASGSISSSLMFGLIMMETTAVYALLVAILLIFVLGGQAA